MEQKKKKINLKIIIPIIVVVIIAIVGIVVLTSSNNNFNTEQNNNGLITGNWKVEPIENTDTFERIVDGFIYDWYDEYDYNTGNTLNDIKVFKNPNKDNYFAWVASVNVYTKEDYNSDGTMRYIKSNDSSAQLREVYLFGYCMQLESNSDVLQTYNTDYTYTTVVTVQDSYASALNSVLQLFELSGESELICVVNDTLVQEFKQKVVDNNNIYNEMLTLLKANKIDDAKNLYYKTTNLTEGQSERCLLLYARYKELDFWGGTKSEINGNSETEDKNDYIILLYDNSWLAYKNIYITTDVENKTYTVTETI